MALDNNQFDGRGDIAQFLEKFKEQTFSSSQHFPLADASAVRGPSSPEKPAPYEKTFEKLEQKIQELEEKFETAAGQNQLILSELARQREAIERQKDKDAFVEHLSRSIANLKASVENLSRARQDHSFAYSEPAVQRSFDTEPAFFKAGDAAHTAIYHYQPDNYRAAQAEKMRREYEEKERIISSLHQKASQLKAVNSALDREIKKVQQEKLDALKKSAEQAKEILSLRDQLTAAEERFKSFDFEGRIISIKQQYQQKVTSLENQLQEISDTCMRQVEEIESLRAENVKLHKAAEEKEDALKRLEAKERELEALKAEMAALREDHSKNSQKQLSVFSERLRTLETQRDELSVRFQRAQEEVEAVRKEKELLEQNFKTLVEKIHQNDAVIEELKRKIEVLGKQNEELVQQNAVLFGANENLSREKQEAQTRADAFVRENAELHGVNDGLLREKTELQNAQENLLREKTRLQGANDALVREKAELAARMYSEQGKQDDLARKIAGEKEQLETRLQAAVKEKEELSREKQQLSLQALELQKQTRELSGEKQQLSKENQQLRNQSAALLAARLVQEKERAAKEEILRKASEEKKNVPTDEREVSSTVFGPAEERLSSGEKETASVQQGAPSVAEKPVRPLPPSAVRQEAVPLSEMPVTMSGQAPAKVRTEADLPEIKVADPIPQPEPLFDGEDFLEKTDSFIGRMKWSIFREDK